jgi:hypothetical protein
VKHYFILDENVIAQTKARTLAIQVIELFSLIKANCHQIVLDATLNAKLHSWLTRRDAQFGNLFPLGPTLVRSVLTDTKKRHWVDTHPALKERKLVHHPNDWYIVDLAISCKNVHFVSTGDSTTRKNFNRSEFKTLGIDGITVKRAIKLAQDH